MCPVDLQTIERAVRPLIDAEAAVFDTYWTWSGRSEATDRLWIARQCRKEFWDSFVDGKLGLVLGPIDRLSRLAPDIDRGVDRHTVLDIVQGLRDELAHYVLFADLLDDLGGAIDPMTLKRDHGWPHNDALGQLRAEHRQAHGALGLTACRITEGGFGTLFQSGARLAGRPGLDGRIADVCRQVGADEAQHRDVAVPAGDVDLLIELVTAQQRQRVAMRNAQFSFPLGPEG